MELEDFKSILNEESERNRSTINLNSDKMTTLIEELKKQDAEDRRKTFYFIIMFFVFVIVYTGTRNLHQGGMRTGFSILVFAFILILGYFFWGFQRLKRVNYSAPAIQFLKEAEKRYRFMTIMDWIITIPLIGLLITGGGMIVHYTFIKFFGDSFVPLFIYLGFMVCIVGFGFWASIDRWRKSKGLLLRKIRQLQHEIGE